MNEINFKSSLFLFTNTVIDRRKKDIMFQFMPALNSLGFRRKGLSYAKPGYKNIWCQIC